MGKVTRFEDLLGVTLVSVDVAASDEVVELRTDTGRVFRLYHMQDCCENVYLAEIVGDLADIIDHPLLVAECVEHDSEPTESGTSTWTFYKLSTIKGSVTLRWLGESNGYYSESVEFEEVGA